MRLDEIVETFRLPPPNLIKIDVDGPELAVLRGATQTLRLEGLRGCLIELDEARAETAEAVGILEAAGFRLRSRHPRGDGTLFNTIYERPADAV